MSKEKQRIKRQRLAKWYRGLRFIGKLMRERKPGKYKRWIDPYENRKLFLKCNQSCDDCDNSSET